MRKIVLAAALAAILPLSAAYANEGVELPKQEWSFNGVFGKFDKQQLQRGFQVYKEVCASCHSLKYIAFRNLEALGYNEAQIKALAQEYQIQDGPDDAGDMFKRKGKASDYLPHPFPNDQAARASNGGALPPDLSLVVKARKGGPDYVYNLLLGYGEPPADIHLATGMSYNKYFAAGGFQIAMPQQVKDGVVTFADGTPNDAKQIARDVTAFLMWTAEPKMEIRHSVGFRVMLFALIFTVLAYFLKRRIWARIGH
jgi:cytochrome c1